MNTNIRTKLLYSFIGVVVVVLLTTTIVLAGNVYPDNPPGSTHSYTLQDLYNRLSNGTTGSQSTFTEPSTGPGTGSMHTLNEIMGKAPSIDEANGANSSQVLIGRTFWGLTGGQWGVRTGTMANNGGTTVAPSTSNRPIAQGYHDGSGYVLGDADLLAENIKSGVNLFGVDGNVIQSTGNATAADVLVGKTFSNASQAGIAGNMPNAGAVVITPSTSNQAIAQGYHSGAGYVVGDGDLAPGNIKSGVNLFSVDGNVIQSTGNAAAADVLVGKTFSNDGEAGIAGSMPDAGTVVITPTTTNQAIAQGSHSGAGYVVGDADLAVGNIRSGVALFGLTGKCYRLPSTGQTVSYGSWDDGAFQLGCLPAVAPCSGADGCGFNRKNLPWNSIAGTGFWDKGDGTVLDVLTGLIWLKNAHCFSSAGWAAALSDVNALNSGECGLSDGSVEGDWRLPNENELRSLIDPDHENPALPVGHPFTNVQTVVYYSSSSYDTGYMWGARMDEGYVANWSKSNYFTYNVWPVRGGQ